MLRGFKVVHSKQQELNFRNRKVQNVEKEEKFYQDDARIEEKAGKAVMEYFSK